MYLCGPSHVPSVILYNCTGEPEGRSRSRCDFSFVFESEGWRREKEILLLLVPVGRRLWLWIRRAVFSIKWVREKFWRVVAGLQTPATLGRVPLVPQFHWRRRWPSSSNRRPSHRLFLVIILISYSFCGLARGISLLFLWYLGFLWGLFTCDAVCFQV